MKTSIGTIVLLIGSLALASGCAGEEEGDVASGALDVTVNNGEEIAGTFVHGGSVLAFSSRNIGDAVDIGLDVNGAIIDMSVDTTAGTLSQNGHLNALYNEDIAALLALRDALLDNNAEDISNNVANVVMLTRYVDRLADAPNGITVGERFVDTGAQRAKLSDRGGSCGNDGVTCLNGYSGTATAWFDKGNGGQCYYWSNRPYGTSASDCQGRCGAGCAWYDKEATQDCLDHDYCIDYFGGSSGSGSSDCGDEFWDADGDWALTVGDYC